MEQRESNRLSIINWGAESDAEPVSLGSGSIHRFPRGLLHWDLIPEAGRKLQMVACHYWSLPIITREGISNKREIPLLGTCPAEAKVV